MNPTTTVERQTGSSRPNSFSIAAGLLEPWKRYAAVQDSWERALSGYRLEIRDTASRGRAASPGMFTTPKVTSTSEILATATPETVSTLFFTGVPFGDAVYGEPARDHVVFNVPIRPVGVHGALLNPLTRIARFGALGADWDGDGAAPFPPQSIERAISLLSEFAARLSPPTQAAMFTPDVGPSSAGEIVIEWDGTGGRYVIAVVDAEGPIELTWTRVEAANLVTHTERVDHSLGGSRLAEVFGHVFMPVIYGTATQPAA